MSNDFQQAIDLRYSGLAESACCLSCGGAVDHGEPREGEVCVDLGSGRGQDVLRMAEAVGATGMVYGIDTAEGMLDKARRTAQKMGVSQVKFLRAELESLPLPDGHVDLLVSNCTLNHARDKTAVWNEIHRVLAPGGRFVVSDIYSLEEVPDEYRNDPEAVAECWAGAQTRQVYLDTVAAAGLNDVSILEESKPYDKGHIRVASFTVRGSKKKRCCGG